MRPADRRPRSSFVYRVMTAQDNLSISDLTGLISVNGIYFVAFSWLFGQTIWVSFIGGVIAHRTLTRSQFASLQAKSFPAYFLSSTVLSTLMFAIWTYTHPDLASNLTNLLHKDVVQAVVLLLVIILQGANYLFIGPKTNAIVAARQRQERDEGKSYSDPSASDAMKSLNKQFGAVHGLSSLCNLFVTVGLAFHALWLGKNGLVYAH